LLPFSCFFLFGEILLFAMFYFRLL
jgi:hypothetical protein